MENINIVEKDPWISPYSIKIIDNFLDDEYYEFFKTMIENRNFVEATQGVGGKNIVQKQHKVRLDYTLNNQECARIDEHFLKKADCNCNLRERWRLLYYKGEDKAFRDAHTDWTHHSCHRRMSIIIGYSDPSEYVGGELVFKNNNLKYKLGKGSAVIFDAKLVHEVLPVTEGNRYVIQAFLFDDTGYDLKKEKNGKRNFELLKTNNTVNVKPKILTNKLFNMMENKNAVHSRIKSVDDCFIGNFKYVSDLNDYLDRHKHFHCFTWHKPDHDNKKWAGKAYAWTKDQCIMKQRLNSASWPSEQKVISGLRINIPNNINTSDNNNYLTLISTDGGPGNQVVGIKEGLMMAKYLNRKFISPPIIQHYVLNRKYRGNSEINLKYWHFNEIFKLENEEIKDLMKSKDIIENEETIYYLKKQDIDKPLRMEKLLSLPCNNKFMLNKRNFANKDDYNELLEKQEKTLIINDLYNSTKISQCYWNGCDTCPLNEDLKDDYSEICKNLDFSDKIKNFGDLVIKNMFGDEEFICIHIRYPDYVHTNMDIKSINKLYNETDINHLAIFLADKYKINKKNVFIATCNKAKILSSDLKNYHFLNNDEKYNECESFIEQYIAIKSKYFIFTGGIHAKPDHKHLRSTWSSFVLDYRTFKLNIEHNHNIYLTEEFQNKNNL